MQTTTTEQFSNRDDDESMHPLWLGMLLLFSVILIIGILCCLRVKYGSQLRHRFFGRKMEMNEDISPRPPPPKTPSPKLYTLVTNLRRAQLQKQRQQDDEDEVSISPSVRNSEIARKFYASMRNTSQCQNSSSVDDASLVNNTRQGRLKLFRIPRFFKSIPQQDSVVIVL